MRLFLPGKSLFCRQYWALITGMVLLCLSQGLLAEGSKPSAEAIRISQKAIIVDTHIDVPFRIRRHYTDVTKGLNQGDFDYPRAVKGGLNVPFMSIFVPASFEDSGDAALVAHQLIDSVEAMVGRSPKILALAASVAEVRHNFSSGQLSLAMGMENGAPIAGNLDNLDLFFERGVRYITLAHAKSNHIADSSYDENRQWQGLSPFGRELIPAMNKRGMMIDVSHISDEAFFEVMTLSKVPVIASHSSARFFTPGFERNMSDQMITLLAKQGGVIQINFGSQFISARALRWTEKFKPLYMAYMVAEKATFGDEVMKKFTADYRAESPYPFVALSDVLDHFDHVVNLAGIDYVGIGSDYDGVGDTLPASLKDVSYYPQLIDGLLARGYGEASILKILGENLLRVWKEVEHYAEQ